MTNDDASKKPQMFHHAPAKSFQYALQNRLKPTEAEDKLWNALKGKQLGGFKFRRQHPACRYILDFYCHVAKIAVEVDGGYHFTPEQAAYDAQRTAVLQEVGITVLRFTNNQVMTDFATVLNCILETIKNQQPSLPEE
ncbi:MAG: endonuclease domain-containing protein [Chitinophagales bacterium]|nr:endonuclease domain-containing protein [Chitinophagales bacterium]